MAIVPKDKLTEECPACEPTPENPLTLGRKQIGNFADRGNLPGALGASFSLAVGDNVGTKIGNTLGRQPADVLMNLIDTPGTPTQKRNMSSSEKKNNLITSVGMGNFSLNSTFESGLINSVNKSKSNSFDFLNTSDTGGSIMAASALGIDIPKSDLLGVSSEDNPFFGILKLAALGLKVLCGVLRDKKRNETNGYKSPTEELIGLILSIASDLLGDFFDFANDLIDGVFDIINSLINRLKEVFDCLLKLAEPILDPISKLLNIADTLFNLCDWVENMEFGSPTLDMFRDSFPAGITNKDLTNSIGNKLISDGTFEVYAKNDFKFDQQFKSIVGDIDDKKCEECKSKLANISILQNSNEIATLEFDTISGLSRSADNQTTLKESFSVGETRIESTNEFAFKIGDTVKVAPGTDKEEIHIVSDVGSIQFKEPLKYNHSEGTLLQKTDYSSYSGGLLYTEDTDTVDYATKDEIEINDSVSINNLNKQSDISANATESVRIKKPIDNKLDSDEYQKNSVGGFISNNFDNESVSSNKNTQTPLDNDSPNVIENKKRDPNYVRTRQLNPIEYEETLEKNSVADFLGEQEPPQKQISLNEELSRIKSSDDVSFVKKENGESDDDLIKKIKQTNPTPSYITQQKIKNDNEKLVNKSQMGGIEYKSDSKHIVYNTHQNKDGDIVTDVWESTDYITFNKTNTKTNFKKPHGGDPAKPGDTSVTSFYTGETISREELTGTVLENADLNAVGLLHPKDLENLKNTESVNKTLETAEKIYDNTLNLEIEKTINLVLEEQSPGIIFGAQLPSKLQGNQIVINSERVLISAKTQECGIFSKRKFFVSTDDEITMNAKQRIVLKTDSHTSIESPTIHLGVYTTRNHPSLKGDCTVKWLQDLCDWLSSHRHYDPFVTTSTPKQQGSLAALRARAPTLLSERIFISG